MRKLTANEINEFTEVFKATLEACATRTARAKTAEAIVEIGGSETDLASLPVGTSLVADYGIAFKTSRGWIGSVLAGDYFSDEEAAVELAGEGPFEFMYNPSSSSPVGSIDFEDEEEWFEAVTEDELINFSNYPLYLDPATMDSSSVVRVNGSSVYLIAMADAFYNEDGEEFYSTDGFAEDVAKHGFPLHLEIFPRYR